jgi:type VI secretion system protein ImpF
MAELTSQERLQPSLLDRLTDADPGNKSESLDARVLSRQQLRAAVLRDLSWLFNANRAEPSRRTSAKQSRPAYIDEEAALWKQAPFAQHSVLNYGLPSLEVEAQIDGSLHSHHNQLKLVIRGHMWNQPVPLELLLSASMDVETGQSSVRDMRG